MATAIINGRRVELPSRTTATKIREAGGIQDGRNVIRQSREGNYLVPLNTPVEVVDGDRFVDAPARVKGGERR